MNQIHFNALFEGGLIYWGGESIIIIWMYFCLVAGRQAYNGSRGERGGGGGGVWLISSSLWHSF